MLLLPPPLSSTIMSFTFPSFRKAPHSPSPSIAPLSSFLHSFTPHPPSVVALVPLLIQLYVCGSQHYFRIKTHSHTLLSLIVLPSHHVLLPGKTKKTSSSCGSCGRVSFYCLAAYLPACRTKLFENIQFSPTLGGLCLSLECR